MEEQKTLTLKSLKKDTDKRVKDLETQLAELKVEIDIIKKVLTK